MAKNKKLCNAYYCPNYEYCKNSIFMKNNIFTKIKNKIFNKKYFIENNASDLSGTDNCYYHFDKFYTCENCKHCTYNSELNGYCSNTHCDEYYSKLVVSDKGCNIIHCPYIDKVKEND